MYVADIAEAFDKHYPDFDARDYLDAAPRQAGGSQRTAGPVPTREEKRQFIREFIAWNFPPGWGLESGN